MKVLNININKLNETCVEYFKIYKIILKYTQKRFWIDDRCSFHDLKSQLAMKTVIINQYELQIFIKWMLLLQKQCQLYKLTLRYVRLHKSVIVGAE